MAPNSRIYLTRHAQAEHNVDLDYSSTYFPPRKLSNSSPDKSPCIVPDAPLTPLGKKQASSIAHLIPSSIQDKVDLVVTSPLTRTLQTTLLGWAPSVSRLGKENIICLPAAQECNDFPCDTGSSQEILKNNSEFSGLNLSRCTPDWTSKQGFWAADRESIRRRARFVRQFLRERPEKDIVLVAHGDILRQITATEDGPGTYMWKNAEMRVYTFDEKSVDRPECFLKLEEVVEAVGGYAPTSTAMDVKVPNGKI